MQPQADPDHTTHDFAESHLMTVPEVHAMTCLSEKTIRRAIVRGELRAMKLCNRVRIAPDDLDAWLRESVMHAEHPSPRPVQQPRRHDNLPVAGGLRDLLEDR